MGLLGTLGSLNVLLQAETAQFNSAMTKAAFTAEKSLQKIGFAAASVRNITVAVGTGLVAFAKSGQSFADNMSDMAERVGLSVTKMSELAYAAKMTDVDITTLETSLKKLAVNVFDNSIVFENLGIAIKDKVTGRSRDLNEILRDVADKFASMPDTIGKAKVAVEAFGKSGADIRPLLEEGSAGLDKYAEGARKLGVVIEDETAKNAKRFDDFVKNAQERMKGWGIKVFDVFSAVVEGAKLTYMPLDEFNKRLEDYKKDADAAFKVSKDQARVAAEMASAYEAAAEAAEKKRKMEDDGKKLTEQMRTAQEKYNDELEFYNTLLQGGVITQETYARAAKKSMDNLVEGEQKTNKLQDAAKDMGFSFQSAFEDAIIDGKKFQDVLVGLGKDIERILLRKTVTEPLANALSAGISGFFAKPTPAVPVTSATPSRRGNIFNYGDIVPFANGGVISGPVSWPMSGGRRGLAGEAGQEVIAPLFRTSSGDMGVKSVAPRVEVNVYAPEGSKVQQERKFDGDREQINIMIDEAVAGNVGRPGSKTHRSIRNTFGVSQALTAR